MVPTVELREITRTHSERFLILGSSPSRRDTSQRTLRSIAEAHFEPHTWFRAVYADDDPVGFVMAYRDPPEVFWVWRFMIDARHQGKGYGFRALELLVEEARADGAPEIEAQLPLRGALAAGLLPALRLC